MLFGMLFHTGGSNQQACSANTKQQQSKVESKVIRQQLIVGVYQRFGG